MCACVNDIRTIGVYETDNVTFLFRSLIKVWRSVQRLFLLLIEAMNGECLLGRRRPSERERG